MSDFTWTDEDYAVMEEDHITDEEYAQYMNDIFAEDPDLWYYIMYGGCDEVPA